MFPGPLAGTHCFFFLGPDLDFALLVVLGFDSLFCLRSADLTGSETVLKSARAASRALQDYDVYHSREQYYPRPRGINILDSC